MKVRFCALLVAVASSAALFAEEQSDLPIAAVKLEKDYQKASETAVAPIRDRYVAEMKKLYDDAFKNKDINQALAIKQKMNAAIAQSMAGDWKEEINATMTIHRDGTSSHTNGATGRWIINGDNMEISWSNGARHVLPVVPTNQTLKGKLYVDPDHEKNIALTRIR